MAHPLAEPIREAAAGVALPAATDVIVAQGDGVEGCVGGARYRLGRPQWAWPGFASRPEDDGATLVLLADAQGPCALFVLEDALRAQAPALVRALAGRGLDLALVSGDRAVSVQRVAHGVAITDVHADVRPAGKCAFVQARQAKGDVVAMIGDGLNDAPALAQADVSIAFGEASALTRWSADIVVLGGDLSRVDAAFDLARRTRAVIRQNLAWAAGYNVLAIPLAVAGFVSPLWAALGMSVSSLLVVANALRLARAPRHA